MSSSPGESSKAATSTATTTAAGPSATVEFEPPVACVRRILKAALPPSTNTSKDAIAAFTRGAGIFVIYLTTCANDIARENKRQTITANDVLKAVKELDFEEFTPELKRFLENHRVNEKSKKDAKAKAALDAKRSFEEAGMEGASQPEAKKARSDPPDSVEVTKEEMTDDAEESPEKKIDESDSPGKEASAAEVDESKDGETDAMNE